MTPESVAQSEQLKLLSSNFPARRDEPKHELTHLAGRWRGEYTIRDLSPATIEMEFDEAGKFQSGTIRQSDGEKLAIRGVELSPIMNSHDIQAVVFDARGFRAVIDGGFRDQGRRIAGTWKDDQAYRGVFAIEKDAGRNVAQ